MLIKVEIIDDELPEERDNKSLTGLEIDNINPEGVETLDNKGVKITDEGVNIRLIIEEYNSVEAILFTERKDENKGTEDVVLIEEIDAKIDKGNANDKLEKYPDNIGTKDAVELVDNKVEGVIKDESKEAAGIDNDNKGEEEIAELEEGIPSIIDGNVPGTIDEI